MAFQLPFTASIMASKSSEKLPTVKEHERISETPFVDETDEKSALQDSITVKSSGSEKGLQSNMGQSLWRRLSDQFAFEGVQNSDHKQDDLAAAVETTWEESSEDERFTSTPPGDKLCRNDKGDENEVESDDESPAYLSPAFMFQSTFSDEQQDESSDKPVPSYLDPSLARNKSCRPNDLPKTINPRSMKSIRDAPKQVSIDGSRKHVSEGMVELHPGKFVNVHGKQHAHSAIAKGKSTIVKCCSCGTKFQVDCKARALYCTKCDSVTPVQHQHNT